MNASRIIKYSIILCCGLLLFALFVYAFIPVALVEQQITSRLTSSGLNLTSAGVRKTVLPGILWKDAVISGPKGVILRFDRLEIRLHILPLFIGRLAAGIEAGIGATGRLQVQASSRAAERLAVSAEGIRLKDIPFFSSTLGASVDGSLRAKGNFADSARGLKGDMKLELAQLSLSGLKLGGFSLPDVSGLATQGMLRASDGRMRVESLTLQGDGVFMRLSGDIPAGADAVNKPLNLTLDIMPKPEFMEKQKLIFMLLVKFMASPGNYRIPIKGTLLKPDIL